MEKHIGRNRVAYEAKLKETERKAFLQKCRRALNSYYRACEEREEQERIRLEEEEEQRKLDEIEAAEKEEKRLREEVGLSNHCICFRV